MTSTVPLHSLAGSDLGAARQLGPVKDLQSGEPFLAYLDDGGPERTPMDLKAAPLDARDTRGDETLPAGQDVSFANALKSPAAAATAGPTGVAAISDIRSAAVPASVRPGEPVLDHSAPAGEPLDEKTFGFPDLGVFGISAGERNLPAISAAASPPSSKASASVVDSAPASIQTSAVPIPSVEDFRAVDLSGSPETGRMCVPRLAITAESLREQSASSTAATETAGSTDTDEAAVEFGSGAAGAKLASGRPMPVGANDISLTVAGSNENLAIAARGLFATGDEAIRLQRLFELTAAEFNMRIGELALNGAIERPAMKGGILGSFTG